MILRSLVMSLVFALVAAGAAVAQPAAPYAATPPTKGALYRDGQNDRYLLGGTWLYRADPGDLGLAQGWWRNIADPTGWSPVAVPSSWNVGDFSPASMAGSVGWYRRDFTLPGSAFAHYVPAADRAWIVRFESVNYHATVWLNGRQIGDHFGAYLPFEFDLKGMRRGVNRLIVRVDDRRTAASLPPGPSGQWWNFGGLQREVYLRSVQRADLSVVQVRPLLPCPTCAATVNEQVTVRNVTGAPQTVALRGAFGPAKLDFGAATIAPHASWIAIASVRLPHPQLWAIDHPYLYRASLTLKDAHGRALEGYATYSGVRSIQVTPDGRLTLNGRLLDLRGVNLHEQSLLTGAALDPAQNAALVNWTRELGGTIIRAHYPLSPELEELADADGLLLWSEVPVYQTNSRYLSRPGWLAHAHSVLTTNILTNQNHPSVLLWSIGNELPTPPGAAEADYIAGAAAIAHRLDPTRPVGMAISDWPGVPCQTAYSPLDVIGFNDYFGWFGAGGGATDDRDALSPFLDSLRACYPSQALMITEFGFDSNQNGPVDQRATYAFQSDAAAFHLGVFASKPWLSGAMYHTLQEYDAFPAYSGGNPFAQPPLNQKGLIDQQGNFKPAFAVVSAIYHATVQIAPPAPVAPSAARRGR